MELVITKTMSVANNLSRAPKWGLGRSEPDINMYSRLAVDARRPSAIQVSQGLAEIKFVFEKKLSLKMNEILLKL